VTNQIPIEISCQEVWREISNFLDGTVQPALRARMSAHFSRCKHCTAILEGTSNTIRLVGDGEAFDLPAGLSERLQDKLRGPSSGGSTGVGANEMSLGVADGTVQHGSHLVYFWQNQSEFAQGVSFLEPGLRENQHCVVFGHDEVNDRVMEVLGKQGYDVPELIRHGRLTILPRVISTKLVLSKVEEIFTGALRRGFSAIRYLGNLGWGYPGCPEQDEVLELEARVTGLAEQFPCVVVCMYDVNTLPGRMVLKGGFETHPFTLCTHGVLENPLYVPESEFLAGLCTGVDRDGNFGRRP
jgi:MEDS: MEthanogen/methylotroph, DcmR Sensory domain/Putative zinc-finger